MNGKKSLITIINKKGKIKQFFLLLNLLNKQQINIYNI